MTDKVKPLANKELVSLADDETSEIELEDGDEDIILEPKEHKTLLQRYMLALQKMPNPVKDTDAYKYKYAQLDQVLSIVRSVLAEEGLAVYQRSLDGAGDEWNLVTSITDGETEKIVDIRTLVQSDNAQIKGSYETYMRRYALLSAFGLAAEDDDGQATVPKPAQDAQSAKMSKYPRTNKNTPQNARECPQNGNEADSSNRFARIAELKAACLDAGIQEEGLRSWLISTFKLENGTPKPMREFSEIEIRRVEQYFSQLLHDMQEVKAQKQEQIEGLEKQDIAF